MKGISNKQRKVLICLAKHHPKGVLITTLGKLTGSPAARAKFGGLRVVNSLTKKKLVHNGEGRGVHITQAGRDLVQLFRVKNSKPLAPTRRKMVTPKPRPARDMEYEVLVQGMDLLKEMIQLVHKRRK